MANQLFNELVKLASEKVARDPWFGGGGGRGGFGGGSRVFASRNAYAGPHPAMLPGMVAGQRVRNQGMQQMLPEEVQQRKYQQQFQDTGISGFENTSEGKDMLRQQADLVGARKLHQQAADKHTQLGVDLEALKGQRDAARQSLINTAGGHSRLLEMEGGGNWANDVGAGLAKLTRVGDAEAKAYSDAKGKHEAAERSHTTASTAFARQAQEHEATVRKHNDSIAEYQKQMKEYATQSRQDLADRARSRGPGGAPGGMPNQKPQPEQTAIPAPHPDQVPPLATHAPGGGLQAPAPIPRGRGLRGGPGNVVPGGPPVVANANRPGAPRMASSFMPFTTMDNLIEGAARNMFDRYVKVAQAKLAVDVARSKPVSFNSGTSDKKDKPRSKKANSMPLPSHFQKMLDAARSGSSSPGESSVDLGEHKPGIGSPMRATPPAGNSQMPTEASPKKLPPPPSNPKATQIMPTSDIAAALELEQLRKAHMANPAIAAERAAFAAKYGPKPGAGSQFFRARATVPQGKMAAARVLCLS
jgi:hypothetical protein